MLKKLLVFNPDKRLNATEALSHPYLTISHDHVKTMLFTGTDINFEFEYQSTSLTREDLQKMIVQEILTSSS